MKCKLSVDKVALTLAILFAALHTAGVLGIRVGLMGLLEWAHMVTFQYSLQPFSLLTLVAGTVSAGVVGYAVGLLFSALHKKLK